MQGGEASWGECKIGGTVPVFRFWSQKYGHHFYTTSEAEKDHLIATNPHWKYERIAFYALPPEANRAAAGHAAAVNNAATVGAAVPETAKDTAAPEDKAAAAEATAAAETDSPPAGKGTKGFAADDRGVFRLGACKLEISYDPPDVEELGDREEAEELETPFPVAFRVPAGGVAWQLWSAERGILSDGNVSGPAIVLHLPDLGLWHWLRFFDAEDATLSSTWLFLSD